MDRSRPCLYMLYCPPVEFFSKGQDYQPALAIGMVPPQWTRLLVAATRNSLSQTPWREIYSLPNTILQIARAQWLGDNCAGSVDFTSHFCALPFWQAWAYTERRGNTTYWCLVAVASVFPLAATVQTSPIYRRLRNRSSMLASCSSLPLL